MLLCHTIIIHSLPLCFLSLSFLPPPPLLPLSFPLPSHFSPFPLSQIPKHVPLHVRKKIQEKPPPRYFEVEPSTGILLPGQRADIRVRFMPSEEVRMLHSPYTVASDITLHPSPNLLSSPLLSSPLLSSPPPQLHYVERIPFSIRQNADSDLALHVEGQGSEPQVQFNCTLLEFPPVLPFSSGSEAEVIISNPMPYPVEIYSLTFDQQYIDEEEVCMQVVCIHTHCVLFTYTVVWF